MKTKDLVCIGIIAYLSYLLLRKKPLTQTTQSTVQTTGTTSTNIPNGGLNLGQNMDLPNLTPTPANGLSTEVALNSSNISPLVQDNTSSSNEPTQVFGNYNLPTPYIGGSVITPNPIDVVPTTTTTPAPVATTIPQPEVILSPVPTVETVETPIASTSPRNISVLNQLETVGDLPTSVTISPRPLQTATSIITEPILGITPKAEVMDSPTSASLPVIVAEPIKDQLISQCGNNFSIPNNNKEGSYTNYWYDGTDFYMQTTSPLIHTVAVKITKDQFVDGCKKFQAYQSQSVTKV